MQRKQNFQKKHDETNNEIWRRREGERGRGLSELRHIVGGGCSSGLAQTKETKKNLKNKNKDKNDMYNYTYTILYYV